MSKSISQVAAVIEASRPQIWLFAVTSAFCGMIMAAKGLPPIHLAVLVAIGVGPCITAATNLLNAAYDLEVDQLSKPNRPLPTNRISLATARIVALSLYIVGLTIALFFGFWPFTIALVGVTLSVLYSLPPIRIKGKGGFSNLALALGYTAICLVGGWSIFRGIQEAPWLILILLTLHVAGANVVKDFVDYEADQQLNIRTLPVRYGVPQTIVVISPLFLGIYAAIPLLFITRTFELTYLPISAFFVWGILILRSLTRDFSRKNREKAFHHAFFMSLLTEIALALAYVMS